MRVYIVDIDGTLADIDHRLHFVQGEPKKWDEFFEACNGDKPIRDVIHVVRAIAAYDRGEETEIIYLTGRPESVRDKTTIWLMTYGLPNGRLIMRRNGDHRADTIAKRELLEELISEGKHIAGVFEDRPSVVRVWREMGLTVFQLKHEEF